jgi:hypothetical protein
MWLKRPRDVFRALVLGWLVGYGVLIYAPDVAMYHRVISTDGGDPWYSPNWYYQPYTNARLQLCAGAKERWTHNALGTPWYVREVNCDGKHWWTLLKG